MGDTLRAEHGLHSPLSLIQEDERARHVLVLSFNVNLGFFERFALPAARARGARVTVVGDARHVVADPAGVRNAGITYLAGLASCRTGGAFHPKLALVVGEDSLTAAIGSGNLTMNGWHGNAELWTVLRGDDAMCPRAFHEVATWLERLHEQVEFSDGVSEALQEVAGECRRHPVTEDGPRVISSLDRPILEQLAGHAPVDELAVYAPFLDEQASALRRLIDLFSPGAVRLLVQSDKSVFDGRTLAAVADEFGFAVEEVADSRYHHGKLIQWWRGNNTRALTGSANVSIAALGRQMGKGGNCELALLGPADKDLTPEAGESIAFDRLRQIRRERIEAPSSLALLGVTVAGDKLIVSFPTPLTVSAWLEVALGGEAWTQLVRLEPGARRYEVSAPVTPPAALRVVSVTGTTTNVVFATDLERVKRRSIPVSGLRERTSPDGVFTDPRLAAGFQHDLARLQEFLIQPNVPRAISAEHEPGEKNVAKVKFRSWQDYLDGVGAHVGEESLRFGLGLPDLGRLAPGDDEEDAGDRDVMIDTVITAPTLARAPVSRRRQYRQWCRDLTQLAPRLPPIARLIAWRLLLRAVAAGVWDDDAWLPLLGDMAAALAEPTQGFAEEDELVASALAVSLAVARSQVRDLHVTDDRAILFNRMAAACRDSLGPLTHERVEEYARELTPVFGSALRYDSVLDVATGVARGDPLEDAMDALRSEGREVERKGRLLVLDELRGDPETDLLRIVGLAEDAGSVAATGYKDGRWLVAWVSPYILSVKRQGRNVRGDVYKCGITTPRSLGRARTKIAEVLAREVGWFPPARAPAVARTIIEQVGLDPERWLA